MYRYIKSELYRLLHVKSSHVFIGVCTVLLLSFNILLAVLKGVDSSFSYANTKFSIGFLLSFMSMIFILCPFVALLVFGNENSNHTMKNTISYGIKRGTMFYGKLIVQIIYSIVAFFIITSVFILSCYLLLENSGTNEIVLLIKTIILCLPLFIFALGVTNCFLFLVENTGSAIGATAGIIIAFPIVCNMLAMKFSFFATITKYLPWNLINSIHYDEGNQLILKWETMVGYRNYWLAGLLQMLLISLFGYLILRRKEIK